MQTTMRAVSTRFLQTMCAQTVQMRERNALYDLQLTVAAVVLGNRTLHLWKQVHGHWLYQRGHHC